MNNEIICRMTLDACDSVSHRALDIADIMLFFFLE
jgi:hypothetical protein